MIVREDYCLPKLVRKRRKMLRIPSEFKFCKESCERVVRSSFRSLSRKHFHLISILTGINRIQSVTGQTLNFRFILDNLPGLANLQREFRVDL